jgi:hypothetical protein
MPCGLQVLHLKLEPKISWRGLGEMVLRRLFASVSENFRFQEAGHHAVNGNTSEAWPIVRRLRERSPNDVTYIILEGDLFLFEKRPDRALDLYRLAERSLRDRQSTDQETKFLLAYRKTA